MDFFLFLIICLVNYSKMDSKFSEFQIEALPVKYFLEILPSFLVDVLFK